MVPFAKVMIKSDRFKVTGMSITPTQTSDHVAANQATPLLLFETERLRVRQMGTDDVDALHAVYGDADAMHWVGDGQPLPRESCEKWIGVTHSNYAKHGYGMSALVLKLTGQVVGFCGVVHPGNQIEPEIKYAFLRAYWGQGLATETVRGMIGYASRAFGLTRIIATTAPENAASHRVLMKAGMRPDDDRHDDDGSVDKVFVWTQ
jgi:[ribosomal protein S5]-alanine N-acetyltransferase